MTKERTAKIQKAFENAGKKGVKRSFTPIPEAIVLKCIDLGNGVKGNTIKYLHFKYGYTPRDIFVALREPFKINWLAYVHNYINDAGAGWDTVRAHAKADQKRILKEIKDAEKAEAKNAS